MSGCGRHRTRRDTPPGAPDRRSPDRVELQLSAIRRVIPCIITLAPSSIRLHERQIPHTPWVGH
jgi:hypothetical protein